MRKTALPNGDIDEMYSDLCEVADTSITSADAGNIFGRNDSREEFWREMEHSDDPFETLCFYISKGYLEGV